MKGKKVVKISGKPFKSGLKENTIKDTIPHPKRKGKKAYLFYEDDSFVSIEICKITTWKHIYYYYYLIKINLDKLIIKW